MASGLLDRIIDHAIIFGLAPDDEIYEKHWHKGFYYTGTVTPDSCQYVAGYVQKKLYGNLADEMYKFNGLIPPFSLMSKGIGKEWIETHSDQVIKDEFKCFLSNGKVIGLPRYYVKILGLNDSIEMLKLKKDELNKKLDKLSKQGLSSEYLDAVEKRKAIQREYDCQSKDSLRQRKI